MDENNDMRLLDGCNLTYKMFGVGFFFTIVCVGVVSDAFVVHVFYMHKHIFDAKKDQLRFEIKVTLMFFFTSVISTKH